MSVNGTARRLFFAKRSSEAFARIAHVPPEPNFSLEPDFKIHFKLHFRDQVLARHLWPTVIQIHSQTCTGFQSFLQSRSHSFHSLSLPEIPLSNLKAVFQDPI